MVKRLQIVTFVVISMFLHPATSHKKPNDGLFFSQYPLISHSYEYPIDLNSMFRLTIGKKVSQFIFYSEFTFQPL